MTRNVTPLKQLTTLVRWRHEIPASEDLDALGFLRAPISKTNLTCFSLPQRANHEDTPSCGDSSELKKIKKKKKTETKDGVR